jgi:hypothetical protein
MERRQMSNSCLAVAAAIAEWGMVGVPNLVDKSKHID